jgi:hypothetical protein
MLKKISTEGNFKQHDDRTDAEEFRFRVENLQKCISSYSRFNQSVFSLEKDLVRTNINETCIKQVNGLKDFINSTGASYESVYAPINSKIVSAISANKI